MSTGKGYRMAGYGTFLLFDRVGIWEGGELIPADLTVGGTLKTKSSTYSVPLTTVQGWQADCVLTTHEISATNIIFASWTLRVFEFDSGATPARVKAWPGNTM